MYTKIKMQHCTSCTQGFEGFFQEDKKTSCPGKASQTQCMYTAQGLYVCQNEKTNNANVMEQAETPGRFGAYAAPFHVKPLNS